MKLYPLKVISTIIIFVFISACSTTNDALLEKRTLSPESVEIYDISLDNFYAKQDNRARLLKKFPFISNEPVLNFSGKFSNQFYDKLNYRYKSSPLKDVDFWHLRTNPFLEDFIYVLPIWVDKFKRASTDLYENISYSYNLSFKEQEILKWWIGEGGILWVEGGIYSTRYDTFNKKGKVDTTAIHKKIIAKSKNLHFFDKKVHSYLYESKKIDFINYASRELNFTTHSPIEYFKDIKKVKVQTKNFLSADFMPQGEVLLYDSNKKPLVNFVRYGRGGVVFVRPFEFEDKRYDGELLRWKITYYLLNKMYLKVKTPKTQLLQETVLSPTAIKIEKTLKNEKKITLHNLLFELDSYKLKKSSYKILEPFAAYLKRHTEIDFIIAGFTDNIGPAWYNRNLSKYRANFVKETLVKMGIKERRLKTKGFGESKPIASNKTEVGRALNRRVEFIIQTR